MITDKHFVDWESWMFGFGYGTGEAHTLHALQTFFKYLRNNRTYDYTLLEEQLGPVAAWLLINMLCHADIIEYGTSPRFGWISKKGELIREFMEGKTLDQLYELTTTTFFTENGYASCSEDYCNCDEPCNNPLWSKRSAT